MNRRARDELKELDPPPPAAPTPPTPPTPPTRREIEHRQAIEQYEYWLAEADKRFGDDAGVLIVCLVTNWFALEKFQ